MDPLTAHLTEIGFSPIEASVYLAVLAHGSVPAGKIAKLTQCYRANIYQALERLKAKGFISETNGKPKLFQAMGPKHILEDLRKREAAFAHLLPAFEKMASFPIATAQMRIIEGISGWRHLLEEFLDIGKERVVYGVPQNAVELMGDFFSQYHKKRAARKVVLRHLFNFDARTRVKITNRLPYTKSRYLPPELRQPVSTSICGSLVAITVYERKNLFTIVIENASIAKAYKAYFEFLWKLAR